MTPPRKFLALAVLASGAAPAWTQATIYESGYGLGGFGTGNQSVSSLQIPLSFRVREKEQHGWGLRLRVPVTFGVRNFDDDPISALDEIKTLSVVPTAEFELPMDDTWTLIPFAGAGVSHEFESSLTQWLGNAGVKLRADHPWRGNQLTFATALRYGFEIGSDGFGFDDFGRTELGIDLFREIGSNVGGHHLTPGVYSRAFLYWDDVTFVNPSTGAVTIGDEYEVGLSIGTAPGIDVLGLGLPRTFIGYRFGDGLSGIRITFGEIL